MRSQVMDRGAHAAGTDAEGARQVQVRISRLNKTFQRNREAVPVLRDIDLEVEKGELLVLLGPSGCGKTTLLRCLVGLERPTHGTVELGDQVVVDTDDKVFVQPNRRDVAMVFQNYALWPHMKVAANVAYPLKARKMKDLIKEGRVEEVLKVVQCEHLADRYPPELSGGQQQRISLARALAPRPALLLLDEPLSNLDALLRIELRAQLRLLHREIGFTGVYVTHDQEEALALGTRVAVMKEGRFEQIGKPLDVYNRPATEYVADFLGARNRIEVKVLGGGRVQLGETVVDGLVSPELAGPAAFRWRDADLALRTPGTETADGRHWIPGGRLLEILPAGDHAEHVVEYGDTTLFVDLPVGHGGLVPGQAVEIGIDPAHTLCYDADGNVVEAWSAAS